MDELQEADVENLPNEIVDPRDVDDLRRHLVVPHVSLPKTMRKAGHLVDLLLCLREHRKAWISAHAAQAVGDPTDSESVLDPLQHARAFGRQNNVVDQWLHETISDGRTSRCS